MFVLFRVTYASEKLVLIVVKRLKEANELFAPLWLVQKWGKCGGKEKFARTFQGSMTFSKNEEGAILKTQQSILFKFLKLQHERVKMKDFKIHLLPELVAAAI